MISAIWKNTRDRTIGIVNHVLYFLMRTTVGNILLKYGIGLGALAYVLIANWSGLKEVFQRPIRAEPLLLASCITVIGLLMTFLRWHLLVRAVGLDFSRYNAVRLGLVGYYFNTCLPGSLGGDVLKAYGIAREQNRRTVAVATVLIDRIIGLWALVWFVGMIGGVFWLLDDPLVENRDIMLIIRYSIVAIAVSTSIWFGVGFLSDDRAQRFAVRLQKVPKLGGSLAEFWRACWMYRQQSRAVLIAMLMTLVSHTLWVVVFHLSVHAFEPPNPEVDIGTFPEHLIVVPLGMTIQAIFPSPGGIGGGEAAFGGLYKILGKPEVNGIVGCLSQRIVFYGIALIGYIVYTRMRAGIKRNQPPETEKVATPPDPDPGHALSAAAVGR